MLGFEQSLLCEHYVDNNIKRRQISLRFARINVQAQGPYKLNVSHLMLKHRMANTRHCYIPS